MSKSLQELVRFSKYKDDPTVFSPYVSRQLLRLAARREQEGALAYAAAISEDAVQMVFTADGHMMRRAAQRFGVCYAVIVIAEIIEAIEDCEPLGNLILEAENCAFCNGRKYGEIALWIEKSDTFCYLHIEGSELCIATVMGNFPRYFVNPKADALCWLKKDNSIEQELSKIPKFALSDGKKRK